MCGDCEKKKMMSGVSIAYESDLGKRVNNFLNQTGANKKYYDIDKLIESYAYIADSLTGELQNKFTFTLDDNNFELILKRADMIFYNSVLKK